METLKVDAPSEIHGPGHDKLSIINAAVVEKGQVLLKGTVVSVRAGSGQAILYAAASAASASSTVPSKGTSTGNGTISSVDVQNAYTFGETWVLTCVEAVAGAGYFSVVGSMSGNCGVLTVGTQFHYPATSAYRIRLTVADGGADWIVGDVITFTTVAAYPSAPEGILAQTVDATLGATPATIEVAGSFVVANLTGFDGTVLAAFNGRYFGNGVFVKF